MKVQTITRRSMLKAAAASAIFAPAVARAAATKVTLGIVNTVSEPLIVLDSALQVVSASQAFYQHFQVKPEDTVGRKIYDLGNGQWNIPALRQLLEDLLPQKQVLDGYVVEHDFPGLGLRRMVLNARRIVTARGDTEMILLAMVAIEAGEKNEYFGRHETGGSASEGRSREADR